MAQYKVPQDVEADDKLLGPFNFRQFIYLLIVAALIALAWAVWQIFPLFAIIPVIPALFLLLLALPLRKDQPMETYIAAVINFHLKPNKRYWFPGQRESTVQITAPKVVEKSLTKNISEEEAGRRLSFLANIVDSEGLSIKQGLVAPSDSAVREELIAEAEATPDIFESYHSEQISTNLTTEVDRHRAEVVQQMRAAIASDETTQPQPEPTTPQFNAATLTMPSPVSPAITAAPVASTANVATPNSQPSASADNNAIAEQQKRLAELERAAEHERLVELSKNNQFSVATIAKEAKREAKNHANQLDRDEVYISLH